MGTAHLHRSVAVHQMVGGAHPAWLRASIALRRVVKSGDCSRRTTAAFSQTSNSGSVRNVGVKALAKFRVLNGSHSDSRRLQSRQPGAFIRAVNQILTEFFKDRLLLNSL